MVLDHRVEHASRWTAAVSLAGKIGCTAQTLHNWLDKAERDSGRNAGLTTDMAAWTKTLERESRELRQANEILRKASAYFARPPFGERKRSPFGEEELDRPFKR